MSIPTRPRIRKHGTVKLHTVETTPIVFGDRLYRFEYVRPADLNPANRERRSHFHFVDLRTGQATPPFAYDHHMGSAYTDGGVMYAVGAAGCCGSDTLHIFRSGDLREWELWGELSLPGHEIYNTGICKRDGAYTLLYEIGAPPEEAGNPFTFRFARSEDLSRWTTLPREYVFQKDRYAGGPAIYYTGDGYYYVLYLEEYPGPCYANCIARSRDLIQWEYSKLNPVLMFDEYSDKLIADPFLTVEEQRVIDGATDVNNSDMEICEWNGRTIIYYSWGDQQGHEFLAEASWEGTVRDFLESWFQK